MSRRVLSGTYRDKTGKLLAKAYESASAMARDHPTENRGFAAGTAAALLSMGMDKFNRDGDSVYTEEEVEALQEIAETPTDQNSQTNHHFMDRLFDRMLKHTMNDGTIESEVLNDRIHDQLRTKKSSLSIRLLISNFKKLSSKMTGFFAIQYGVIHVITWKKPTKTLCYLFLYTSICVWPHLVLAYPLLFVILGVMLPGYIYCHPMQDIELIKVKKRGQSIWEFFQDSESSSIIDDLLSHDYVSALEANENMLRPISSRSSDSSSIFQPLAPSSTSTSTSLNLNTPEQLEKHREKSERNKKIKKQMNLMMNMRDLQNLTTDILKGMDQAEDSYYDIAGFKDEKLSTLIFYGLLIVTSIIVILGKYIPWRWIFIQSGWSIILLCHPNSKKYIQTISPKKSSKPKPPLPPRPKSAETLEPQEKPKSTKLERSDIIVADSPEIRFIEVFELQYKTPTSDDYSLYNYSTTLFDVKDHLRLSGKTPIGVPNLSKVHPPDNWKFEISFANAWVVDKDPKAFLVDRGLMNPKVFIIRQDNEGWIYDNTASIPDLDYVFRRRRLFRECYRYSRELKRL